MKQLERSLNSLDCVANMMEVIGHPASGDIAVLRRMAASRRAEATIGLVSASSASAVSSPASRTLTAMGISGNGGISIADFDVKASAAGIDNSLRMQAKRELQLAGRLTA